MKNCKRSEGVTKEAVKKCRLEGLKALMAPTHILTVTTEIQVQYGGKMD